MTSDAEMLRRVRRVVVDHIRTGRSHPDEAVRRQALALLTEMDAAGLNVDAEAADVVQPAEGVASC